MERVLVELDRADGPAGPGEVDEFFRAAHSIKGMAASMGFQETTALSHALEDLMDPVRAGAQPLTRSTIDLMLAGVDRLREEEWIALVFEHAGGPAPATDARD